MDSRCGICPKETDWVQHPAGFLVAEIRPNVFATRSERCGTKMPAFNKQATDKIDKRLEKEIARIKRELSRPVSNIGCTDQPDSLYKYIPEEFLKSYLKLQDGEGRYREFNRLMCKTIRNMVVQAHSPDDASMLFQDVNNRLLGGRYRDDVIDRNARSAFELCSGTPSKKYLQAFIKQMGRPWFPCWVAAQGEEGRRTQQLIKGGRMAVCRIYHKFGYPIWKISIAVGVTARQIKNYLKEFRCGVTLRCSTRIAVRSIRPQVHTNSTTLEEAPISLTNSQSSFSYGMTESMKKFHERTRHLVPSRSMQSIPALE